MRGSKSISRAMSLRHVSRRSTLLSMGHRLQSWKATSVASTVLSDGIQTTELSMLSPSQPPEKTISSPSRNRCGSLSGMGTVVCFGMSPGPKRSMAHMSVLSELVKTMSCTDCFKATIFASGKASVQHLEAEVVVRVEVRDVDVREVHAHLQDLGRHRVNESLSSCDASTRMASFSP